MNYFEPDRPYIFLDFDGVCTACNATPGSYITNQGENYGASVRCVAELKRLLSDTCAGVIVSSNWRKFEPDGIWSTNKFGDIKNPLPKFVASLGSAYVGALPPIRHVPKPTALRAWFTDNGIDHASCRYVIFDDDPSEGFAESEFVEHFIMTDYAVGLTASDCRKAKTILLK